MQSLALAHAYVSLDRLVFCQIQNSLDLHNTAVKDRLKENGGLSNFENLTGQKAEPDELLWLLGGCEGLPGFARTHEAFGWSAAELQKGLDLITKSARVIEKMERYPFGILACDVIPMDVLGLVEHLRSYVTLARLAKRCLLHRSEWFLNIAKARLVIHVRHWTGDPHDKEVSGLIAAVTGKEDYGQENQKRWRKKYNYFVSDTQLDPWTIAVAEKREEIKRVFEKALPGIEPTITRLTADFVKLIQARTAKH